MKITYNSAVLTVVLWAQLGQIVLVGEYVGLSLQIVTKGVVTAT